MLAHYPPMPTPPHLPAQQQDDGHRHRPSCSRQLSQHQPDDDLFADIDDLDQYLYHHLQQLEQSQQFSATPLTPASSQQSHSLPPPFLSSSSPPPDSAAASPTYSSPAFSSQNSPSIEFSPFYHESMPGSTSPSPAALPHTPLLKVQNWTPAFGDPVYDQENSSSLLQSGIPPEDTWNSQIKGLTNNLQPRYNNSYQHRRAASGSSGVSGRSTHAASPLGASESSFNPSAFSTSSKPLPTPDQTPIQSSFLQSFGVSLRDGEGPGVDIDMRRHVLGQPQPQSSAEEESFATYSSLAPSVSTLSHNSPATPQTSYPDEFDDGSRAMSHGEDPYPDVDRWMDDYLRFEELAGFAGRNNQQMGIPNPLPVTSQPSNNHGAPQMFPQLNHNTMSARLQAANQGHLSAQSQSPTSAGRQGSPFRHIPSYLQSQPGFDQSQLSQEPPYRNNLPMGAQRSDMSRMVLAEPEPKTISPKDAVLDYQSSPDEVTLFHDTPQFSMPAMDNSSGFQQNSGFPNMEQFSNQYNQIKTLPQQYPFTPQMAIQLQQQQQQRQQQRQHQQAQAQRDNNLVRHTPDFPSHLSSMESTNSGSNTSVNNMTPIGTVQRPPTSRPGESVQRPDDTSSDAGTFTCTYHGCTQRFETPAKLQKHKREAHRQTVSGSHPMARDSSAGSLHNSQAGPHRCERINPSTGKPCNSLFSRPYDLTRHEDTIHNARKQKVRCHICTEEKTFSRNDALTRHMRVVHPEVDWPGKQKRKGRD
ncbi:hypothetical protein FQN50_003286 [Emmonsiellopsis sp. PD_5]|nr:hypothetical protein FQN50_003286 [Emmonsiellopsis sp. PD_5]